jgi:hypothetical protein
MAKHKKKHSSSKHRNGNGGNGGGGGPRPGASGPPRRRRRLPRGARPSFWTAASAIAGGVGGAALNGWAARKGYDPRWVGAALAGVGGLGAWKLDGNMRLASYGLAASGAGASVLEFLDNDEDRPAKKPADKRAPDDTKDAPKEAVAEAAPERAGTGLRQARAGGGGLDRAFNKVRERLHRIYEDDDDDARVDDAA